VGTVLRSDWLSNDALGPQRNITRLAQTISELLDDDQTAQLEFLRDIIGNPFRPVTFSPSWRTEHTVGIAAKMYDEREFAAMPILADALQEAECEDADILAHCREPGVHVRGCWVVDLVLGKA